MPTLIAVGAGVDQRLRAFSGRDVAGHHLHLVRSALDAVHGIEHMLGMAMRGIDHDKVDAGFQQLLGAVMALVADGGGGSHTQTALLVLAGVGVGDRLLDVLHGDEADAAILRIDHQQFFDAMLVQQALGLVLIDAFADGNELVLGHQLGHLLPRIGGEAHVAIGEDADELTGVTVAAALHHRNPGDVVLLHQRQRIGQRRIGADGERIDHHAGLEFLDLADLGGLDVRLEVAMQDANAAGLRHGDRHLRTR